MTFPLQVLLFQMHLQQFIATKYHMLKKEKKPRKSSSLI